MFSFKFIRNNYHEDLFFNHLIEKLTKAKPILGKAMSDFLLTQDHAEQCAEDVM